MEKERVLTRTLGAKLEKEELASVMCGGRCDSDPFYPIETWVDGTFAQCDSIS